MKIQDSSKTRFRGMILALALSVLWTVIQITSHKFQYSFIALAKEFSFSLNLPAAGTEAQRMCTVLAYLTSLPVILLAYLLFVKCPPRRKAGFIPRCAAVGLAFAFAAVVHPKVGTALFPALRGGFSTASEGATLLMNISIILGLGGVLLYFICSVLFNRHRNFRHPLRKTIFTLIVAFLTAVLYGAVLGILGHFNKEYANAVVRNFMPDTGLYSGVFTMVVMAPLVEELGYRGMILTKLKKHLPAWLSVLISSALFAYWHGNPGQIVATFPMGIIFATVYLRAGKLRYAMVVHAVSNLLLNMSMANNNSLVPYCKPLVQLRYLLVDIPLGRGILCAAVTVAAIALILWKGFAASGKKDEYVKRA